MLTQIIIYGDVIMVYNLEQARRLSLYTYYLFCSVQTVVTVFLFPILILLVRMKEKELFSCLFKDSSFSLSFGLTDPSS